MTRALAVAIVLVAAIAAVAGLFNGILAAFAAALMAWLVLVAGVSLGADNQ